MPENFDVSICMTFHAENELVIPTLSSLGAMVHQAKLSGLKVEILAAADNANDRTIELLGKNENVFDGLSQVNFGQPAEARNHLINKAKGRFVAVLDGDDLWSENWLDKAFEYLSQENRPECIVHPEYVYYFFEEDFQYHSATEQVHPSVKSHFVRHRDSTLDKSVKATILLDNFWSAHSMGLRSTYLAHPYLVDDRARGTGIEDWGFNIETVNAGLQHLTVADTLHMVRIKERGSQNARNFSDALLPRVPSEAHLVLDKR